RVLNTEATIALARAAQRAGVKRFIFLSSIRAQSGPTAEHVLTEDLAPQPTEAYGRSKLAAEQGLAELDLDWVALRLGLVYGAGVKGNMAELLRFARAPYPLPLGALHGRRSLLALDNLVAAIDTVLAAPGRLRRPFLVADPAALTIPEMITALRRGLNRSPGLIPVPPSLLEMALRAAGSAEVDHVLAGPLGGGWGWGCGGGVGGGGHQGGCARSARGQLGARAGEMESARAENSVCSLPRLGGRGGEGVSVRTRIFTQVELTLLHAPSLSLP